MSVNLFGLIVVVLQLGVAVFCANLLLLSRNQLSLFLPLALFFVAQTFVSITDVFFVLNDTENQTRMQLAWLGVAVVAAFSQPYLFWIYVKALTSESGQESLKPQGFHILPFLLGVLALVSITTLPSVFFEAPDTAFETLSFMQLLPFWFLQSVDLSFQFVVAVYLWLIINQLKSYTNRLKDLFATTEDRELLWVWWIALVIGVYLVLSMAEVIATFAGFDGSIHPIFDSEHPDNLISLAITWVIALWGLRQQPGLKRTQPSLDVIVEQDTGPKYERSALTEEHARKIASKIERAMVNDLIYRDPNLSLWDLAKHIGVTSAYVSQTLNTTLNSNFFDYINSWRVRDAVEQLRNSDETILVITYDVGFNSRSSFYKAFKREMGTTPSEIRAEQRRQAQ